MTGPQFFQNPAFRQYLSFLRRLHELIRSGADETAEGEALRDSMDLPAESLATEEIECLNGISADFYSLSDHIEHTVLPRTVTSDSFIRESFNAKNMRDYAKSITLLHQAQPHLELWQLSYVRGSILVEAGESLAAADFFLKAADLYPANPSFRFMWLAALAKGSPAAAIKESTRILQEPSAHPAKFVYKAADIAFAATRDMDTAKAMRRTEESIPVFEETILRLQVSGEAKEGPGVLAAAISLLGFCHEHLGHGDEAIQYFNEGLSLFPANDTLRVARGIHLYGTNTGQSVEDFVVATQLHSVLVWPYLFLAHYYLTKGQTEDCLRYAGEALQRSPHSQITADCLEWIAICQATLGYPLSTVLSTFNEALKLSPNNERIKKNTENFERHREAIAPASWMQVSTDALRELGQHRFMPQAA
ncbi:MAG: hypothetical protein O2856_04720 [Planctomycetota bacterium]|nr:hypothetical protein [Planctomycetota bacterium]